MKLFYNVGQGGRAGEEVQIGDEVKDHRGDSHIVRGTRVPRTELSTGRVITQHGEFYPSVFGMEWLEGRD